MAVEHAGPFRPTAPLVQKQNVYLILRKIDVNYIAKINFSLIIDNKRTKTIKEKLENEKE